MAEKTAEQKIKLIQARLDGIDECNMTTAEQDIWEILTGAKPDRTRGCRNSRVIMEPEESEESSSQ